MVALACNHMIRLIFIYLVGGAAPQVACHVSSKKAVEMSACC